jgi:hypothetical protein
LQIGDEYVVLVLVLQHAFVLLTPDLSCLRPHFGSGSGVNVNDRNVGVWEVVESASSASIEEAQEAQKRKKHKKRKKAQSYKKQKHL